MAITFAFGCLMIGDRILILNSKSRSKGFQWYFSFYLIFLAESEESHKDAILLLDEPGLHLHPTAQQELISFFDELAERNMLIYTTHSPFLLDGDHIERIRPVTEEESGHSRIAIDKWPSDSEDHFPAASGCWICNHARFVPTSQKYFSRGDIRLFLLAQLELNMPREEVERLCLTMSISFHVVERGLLDL